MANWQNLIEEIVAEEEAALVKEVVPEEDSDESPGSPDPVVTVEDDTDVIQPTAEC